MQRERPILALSLGFFGIALIVFIVLKVILLAASDVERHGNGNDQGHLLGAAPPAAPAKRVKGEPR